MKIAFWVMGVHFFLLLVAFFSPLKQKENKEKIVVKTKWLPQKKERVAAVEKPAAPAVKNEKPALKSSPPSPLLKSPPKAASKQKEEGLKKKAPVQPFSKKEKEVKIVVPGHLLKELEETIAKIDEKRDKIGAKKRLEPSTKIKPLQTEAFHRCEMSQKEEEYKEALITYLRDSLNLPDFGDVKIQVTLRPDGTLEHLKVLEADSDRNRLYLEKELPLIHFPFPKGTSEKKESTFILTFCNEL